MNTLAHIIGTMVAIAEALAFAAIIAFLFYQRRK
jgi:hypothetical protein